MYLLKYSDRYNIQMLLYIKLNISNLTSVLFLLHISYALIAFGKNVHQGGFC